MIATTALAAIAMAATTGLAQAADQDDAATEQVTDAEQEDDFELPEGFEIDTDFTYETVVRDVERQLEEKEGIERQGLMLSTLMKLKQICNHPAQFLHDGSAFTVERSHELERLSEMLEEVMAEGDSVLIFSQFTEIGSQLEGLLKRDLHYNTYYLHGGTSRSRHSSWGNNWKKTRQD